MASYEDLRYNPTHKKPIGTWMKDITIREKCHGNLATYYDHRDKTMNTVSVALTGISSSAMVASTSGSGGSDLTNQMISYAAGIIAVISTILQAVHKSMQYATLAEKHKTANKQLIKLRFRLEIIVGDNFEDDGEINFTNLTEWSGQYESVLEAAPMIPIDFFKKKEAMYDAEKEIGQRESATRGVVMGTNAEYGSMNSTSDLLHQDNQEYQPLLSNRVEVLEEACIDDQFSGASKSDISDQERIEDLVRANESVGVEKLHKILINEGFNIRKKRVRALKNEILGASPAPVANPPGLMNEEITATTDSVSGDDLDETIG